MILVRPARREVARAAAYISSLGMFRHIIFPSRGRVVTLPTPGIAAQDTSDAVPGALEGAVHGDGIDEILGTGGEKAAPAEGAAKKVQGR